MIVSLAQRCFHHSEYLGIVEVPNGGGASGASHGAGPAALAKGLLNL